MTDGANIASIGAKKKLTKANARVALAGALVFALPFDFAFVLVLDCDS